MGGNRISFSKVNKPSSSFSLPTFKISCNKESFLALFDTGASANFISLNSVELIKRRKKICVNNSNIIIYLPNGKNCEVTQSVTLIIKIHIFTWKLNFLIIPNLQYPMIIGYAAMKKLGIVISPQTNSFYFSFSSTTSIQFEKKNKDEDGKIILSALNSSNLSPDQSVKVHQILQEYSHVLTEKIGKANNYVHDILLSDQIPVKINPYPMSPPVAKELRKHIQELLDQNIIRPSNSPYSSPAFLIKKPNGGFRMCVDYRQLNKKVLMDPFPILNVEHIFQSLGKSKYFSTLDLTSAFYQISLSENSKKYTAFVTCEGVWEFHCCPFGLKTSPSALSRLIFQLFADLRYKFVIAFFDDLLIYSQTWEEHLSHIRLVLNRLAQAGLTVNPQKVQFGKKLIKFLGHQVSENGLQVDPEKTSAIHNLPVPKNIKQVKSFLGMAAFYAKFIHNFAELAAPLNNLKKKHVAFKIGPEQQEAVNQIKQALTSSPVLRFPDFSKPFILQTDASGLCLGSVLLQEFSDGLHPIQYASRRLNDAEKKYSAYELETLSCVWAMEKFKSYLLHQKFILQTDSMALKWLFNHPKNLGRIGRWILRLSQYEFEVEHIRGKINYTADCLSRLFAPGDVAPGDSSTLEEYLYSIQDIPQAFTSLQRLQQEDPDLKVIMSKLEQGHSVHNFLMKDGFLLRMVGRNNKKRVVVPQNAVNMVIYYFHSSDLSAHPGLTKTYRQIARRFWWKRMYLDTKKFIQQCNLCASFKPDSKPPCAIMASKIPTRQWERVHVDLIGPLVKTMQNKKYVLVLTDSFSKWTKAFAIKKANSFEIVICLIDTWAEFGPPKEIVSDNGTPFISRIFRNMCYNWSIMHIRISPYHPSSNLVERTIRNIKYSLAILLRQYCKDHCDWDIFLKFTILSLNASFHESLKSSPASVFLGREMRSPIDNQWNLDLLLDKEKPSTDQAIRKVLKAAHERTAHYFNKNRPKSHNLQIGDVVLRRIHIQNLPKGFDHKFSPRYSEPMKIIRFTSPVSCLIQNINTGQIIPSHIERLKKIHATS